MVGENDDRADYCWQLQCNQPGRAEGRPCGYGRHLHRPETSFDAFSDHQCFGRGRKAYSAAGGPAKHRAIATPPQPVRTAIKPSAMHADQVAIDAVNAPHHRRPASAVSPAQRGCAAQRWRQGYGDAAANKIARYRPAERSL